MLETEVTTREERTGSHSLDAEAKRLLDFKRQNIKKDNLTPCPQCATLVNINANKWHCQVSVGQAIPGRKSPGTPLISRHKSPLSSRRTLDHGEDDDELL